MYVNKSDQQCQKLVKITDLMADLYDCNNDAILLRKRALWGDHPAWLSGAKPIDVGQQK